MQDRTKKRRRVKKDLDVWRHRDWVGKRGKYCEWGEPDKNGFVSSVRAYKWTIRNELTGETDVIYASDWSKVARAIRSKHY